MLFRIGGDAMISSRWIAALLVMLLIGTGALSRTLLNLGECGGSTF
jgi:hypothetical protein